MLLQGILATTLLTLTVANNWATYPQVPKTASINGFADPIYALLPSCAKKCVEFSTGNTPCPYWDTGCFCVMPQWSGLVAQCIAENCADNDVVTATSLAISLCSRVGANTWMMPASISTALSVAAGKEAVATDDGKASASASASASPAESGGASAGASVTAPDASSTGTSESQSSTRSGSTTSQTASSTSSGSSSSSASSSTSASANQAISGASLSIVGILGAFIALMV